MILSSFNKVFFQSLYNDLLALYQDTPRHRIFDIYKRVVLFDFLNEYGYDKT